MYLTRKTLPRRTFLRAMGTAVALPMLDAMMPAFASAAAPTPRFGFIYIANGVIQKQWTPTRTGPGFDLPPILQPFANVQSHINLLSGLSHREADTKGDGNGDHPRASAVWLTGIHAYDRAQPGVEVKLATTVDQMIAQTIGSSTRVPSIELAVDYPTQGACDTGDCFYINTVSWRNATTPNPTESHPRMVFERLFGDGGSAADRLARSRNEASILDSVRAEASRVAATLGAGDKAKLGEYLDSVREVEQRIQHAETAPVQLELPERPTDIPAAFEAHTKLMFDLQALAFRADVTRVFSMIMSRELSARTFASIGVPEQHHAVSHHRNDPQLLVRLAKVQTYHYSLFANFVKKLQDTPDGDGSLLDHSILFYGSGMANSNLHSHKDLPLVVVGGGAGRVRGDRHLAYPTLSPIANVLLGMGQRMGCEMESFGDSSGVVDL